MVRPAFWRRVDGFSLVELLLAMGLTVGLMAAVFHLFRQNERILRDDRTVLEMQQAARALLVQIADEVRMAGQCVPLFSAAFDVAASEGTSVVLAGSTATRFQFRAGVSNIETRAASPLPVDLIGGSAVTLGVEGATLFSSTIGTTPSGKFAYVWGPAGSQAWGWARASLVSVSGVAQTVGLVPVELGFGGRREGVDGVPNTPDDFVRFERPPAVSLEEAVAIFFDPATRSVRRATATDMTDPSAPKWGSAQEVAANVRELAFTYYDADGISVVPSTLAVRAAVTRVDIRVVVEAAENLSNGSRPAIMVSAQSIPRNARPH